MLNSIPRTSLAEQQAKNMYTISSSFCNMSTNHENLLHDQSDIKCTRIIWFTEISWKIVGKGFFQIKSMLLGKGKFVVHDDVIDTINDPPFSTIWHEFQKNDTNWCNDINSCQSSPRWWNFEKVSWKQQLQGRLSCPWVKMDEKKFRLFVKCQKGLELPHKIDQK